jgi:hypothetical protein
MKMYFPPLSPVEQNLSIDLKSFFELRVHVCYTFDTFSYA